MYGEVPEAVRVERLDGRLRELYKDAPCLESGHRRADSMICVWMLTHPGETINLYILNLLTYHRLTH